MPAGAPLLLERSKSRLRSPVMRSVDQGITKETMKIAYVILAYHKPNQLAILVRRLSTDNVGFFIHVDRRVPIEPFRTALRSISSSPVRFLKREISKWGSMGCVQAILNGMGDVLKSKESYDRLVLLSGQDYPLRSNEKILEFFAAHRNTNFIRCLKLPNELFWDGGMYRLDRYTYHVAGRALLYPPFEEPETWKRKLVNSLAASYFSKRVLPPYVGPYAGDTWFDLTREATEYALDFVRAHPDYVRFHRYTHIPEESFFQCILMTLTESRARNGHVNECPRFIKPLPPGIPHPKILTVEDLADLRLTTKLFARKFDIETDATVLDLIDAEAGAVAATENREKDLVRQPRVH